MGKPRARRSGALVTARSWCDCSDAPTFVRGPATLLEHPGGCDFPTAECKVRSHRATVHPACGRELLIRFCACPPSGYTFDRDRGWWVHYYCGWPTQAWFDAAGKPAPKHLQGIRPVTTHEFVSVSKGSNTSGDPLTPGQRRLNDAQIGLWIRD